ncbi:tyrosine--tRNA ligase [Candidatus Pacearchaeota archaeon CG1_02_39_14]|nr:MAG: tyrosine--tRNA ligase [Candidatus Pacearchaeota archaeon CG1_02_39_14]
MNVEERYKLVTRNLQEVVTEAELREVLKKKNPSVYWGTMPTGSPHIAYFLPLLKIADFLKANLKVMVLIADLHAALDGVPWKILEKRQKYYEALIPEMLKSLGVNTKKLKFVKGSKIQDNPRYFRDVLKMSMLSTINDTTRAASEVVKMSDNPKLGNLIYPIMQALDEEYLKADIQFGGLDQRKILVFAREFLPKLGYKARVELMNPIIPGLIGKKMSASIEGSKVDILDDENIVIKKIKEAECQEGNPDNGIMQFAKYVLFPVKQDKKQSLKIERPEKFGGSLTYRNYEEMEKDFISKKLHPLDLKNAVAKEINSLLAPIRKNKAKLQKLYNEAYQK